ncbi:XRE family transcriptional regulator [Vibrio vulnificus]|uniref:helix-turn-helix domain-containing protein n=1 Tax=Vibrio vulnificus TaxID=672 RepID=UPI000D737A21|nr:helix-turn-helix transcriptional regulator [Vibrio vulnificus]PWY28224.1 XRE family transcriptional regulator [Vibrio vulnificus]HAS6219742.1 helix-turn-helix domain-containing protein [Vibrio vulnificus]
MPKSLHQIDPIMQFFTQERMRQRKTQQELSAASGINLRMLQRLEQGERVVDIVQIRKLCMALDVTVSHLILHGAVQSADGKHVASLPVTIRHCLIELINAIHDEVKKSA